jgi:hypothetical protein
MDAPDVSLRAERLRILLELNRGAGALGQDGCKAALRAGLTRVEPDDVDRLLDMTPDDRALGLVCSALEGELRPVNGRHSNASCFLAPGLYGIELTRPAGGGNQGPDAPDSAGLTDAEFAEALNAAVTLGWLRGGAGGAS